MNSNSTRCPRECGSELRAEHPVIRTNPFTTGKSVFAVGAHVKMTNGLAKEESTIYSPGLVLPAADTATNDYDIFGEERNGQRAVSLGERPYLDPNSQSRRQALGLKG